MTSLFPSRTSQMRGVAGCDAVGLGAVGWHGRTADECGAVATRKAMMFAAASGRTACASTSAGMTRPVSGGVKKLRGPDTVRAQLKVEDLDEVAEGRLAEAVRAMPAVGSVPGTCTIVPEPRCRMYGSTVWLSHSVARGLTSTMT